MEIERKFLVVNNDWRKLAKGIRYRQGYLHNAPGCIVRVRVAGDKAYLTVKGPVVGISRQEFEYGIPLADANIMLEQLVEKPFIDKLRYKIFVDGHIWEVDEFLGDNTGLVVAEIELSSENEQFSKPDWIGKEITGEIRYYNSELVKCPFLLWGAQ